MAVVGGICVAELLRKPELAGTRLLAGTSGLGRVVSDVSVLEVPEGFERWLRGGELVLTTLQPFDDPAAAQRRLVRILAIGGAAALGLHPGVGRAVPDAEALRLADALSFPVLLLPEHLTYAACFRAVLGETLNRQALLLRRTESIHHRLTALVLARRGLPVLVENLAQALRRPCAVLARHGLLLAAAGDGDPPPAALIPEPEFRRGLDRVRARLRRRLGQAEARSGPLEVPLRLPGRRIALLVAPVPGPADWLGFLATWYPPDAPPEDWERRALEQAATTVALQLMQERVAVERERRLLAELLDALATGNFAAEDTLRERASQSGVSLPGSAAALFVTSRRPLGPAGRDRLAEAVRRALWAGSTSLVAARGDGVAVVLGLDDVGQPADRPRVAEERARELQANLEGQAREPAVSVGVGPVVTELRQWHRSLLEAQLAARIGAALLGAGVHRSDVLWPYRLLLGAGAEADTGLAATVDTLLAALDDETRSPRLELLRTLDAYLDHGQSVTLAAKHLYVHPNTVRYRLDKIRERLGERVFLNPLARLALHLATKRALLLEHGLALTAGPAAGCSTAAPDAASR